MTPTERQLSACASDPWFFAKHCILTFDETTGKWLKYPDPDRIPEDIPEWLKKRWHKWEYNAKVFEKIEEEGDKYWLKSQRMLITIDFCIFYLWAFLFEGGFNGFMTSKVQDAVDNIPAGWNSLFGKMRAMFDRIPEFIIESQLGRHYHSSEIFKYMAAINPKNGNVIVGHAPTMSCGTGEGYTKALVDETASVYNMGIIHTNLTQSCRDNKHYVSFPRGRNNKFGDIDGKKGHYGFEKVEIDWSMNPRYTKEWYDRQLTKLTGFEIAQRLNRSFEESAIGKVFDKFDYVRNVQEVAYLPEFPICHFWDYGFADATSVLLVQLDRVNNELRIFDGFENNFSDYVENAASFKAIVVRSKTPDTVSMMQGYGDPAGKARSQDMGVSLTDRYLNECGISIIGCDTHETKATIDEINKWFGEGRIIIDPKCEALIDCMRYWEWPKDTQGNPKAGATQPRHDKYSHAGKALEYGFTMLCMSGSSDMTGYLEEEDSGLLFEGIMEQQF